MDRPSDQLLAHAALAANEHSGVAGGGPGDLIGHLLDGWTVADHAALHPQPFAELHDLRADLGEVFRQFLAAIQVFQGHGHRVRHGESELQFVGVRHPLRVGRIEMHQAENLPPTTNRRANHAGRMDDSLAVATAQGAVAHDVAGQDGLAFAHHRGGQDRGDLVVWPLGRAARSDDFEGVGSGLAAEVAPQQEHRAGVGLGALGQTLQSEVGRSGGVGGLGQLEGQPAEFGRRPPHLRDPLGGLFARLKESRLPAAVGDRGRTSAGQGVGLVFVVGARRLVFPRQWPQDRRRVGKRLGQPMHEHQLRPADADNVARLKRPVPHHPLVPHHRPIAAVQVPQHPLVGRDERLRGDCGCTARL